MFNPQRVFSTRLTNMADMGFWTVDTWAALADLDDDFVRTVRSLLPEDSNLFRDTQKERTYWCPRRWEDKENCDAWHTEMRDRLRGMISESATHLMELVTPP